MTTETKHHLEQYLNKRGIETKWGVPTEVHGQTSRVIVPSPGVQLAVHPSVQLPTKHLP